MTREPLIVVALWLMRAGLAVILLLPLYVAPAMLYPFVTGKAFAFRILVEAMLVPWALLLALSPEHRPRCCRLTTAVIVFAAVVTVADIFGVDPARSFWSSYARMDGLNALLHLLAFFLMLGSVLTSDALWRAYFRGSVAVSAVVAVLAIAERVAAGHGLVAATVGNAGHLSAYLMLHAFLLLFLLAREPRLRSRLVLMTTIAVEILAMSLTGSRAALGALVVAAAATLAVTARGRHARHARIVRRLASAAVVVGLVAVVVTFAARHTGFVRDDPSLSRLFDGSTVSVRLALWDAAWAGVKERPWRGWGQENFSVVFGRYHDPARWAEMESWADRSHNVLLDWLVAAGVPGLVAYLALFGAAAWNVRRALARGHVSLREALTLDALLVAYFVQNLFSFDTLQTYLVFFSALAYSVHLGAVTQAPSARAVRVATVGTKRALALASAVGLLVGVAVYSLNARPMRAAREIALGVDAWSAGRRVVEAHPHFQRALEDGAFGSAEAAEWMATIAAEALTTSQGGAAEDVAAFVRATVTALTPLTHRPAVDARHLFMLGTVARSAIAIDPAYGVTSVAALERAVTLAPTNAGFSLELASAHLARGEHDRAVAVMQQAAARAPARGRTHAALAAVALRAGRPDVATVAMRRFRTLVLEPERADLLQLADAHVAIGDRRSARVLVDEIIARRPDDAHASRYRAVLLAEIEDPDGAVIAARRAAPLDPAARATADPFVRGVDVGR